MKTSPLAVAGFVLASAAQAQVVQWDLEKRLTAGPELRRRAAGAFDAPLLNEQTQGGYFISVAVGNPSQKITLQLDTGSSDVWVPYAQADICVDVSDKNPGCTLGSFDPHNSQTFQEVGKGLFDIQYVDQSSSQGDYFQDEFQIGGTTVKNLTMGLGLKTSIAFGLIGVGYRNNEAAVETTRKTYPNLPVVMQQEGLIKTIAYSLWLNDLSASKGSILFGGIDTEKYVGNLTRLDIIPSDDGTTFAAFTVELFSVEATSPSGNDVLTTQEENMEVVLDSGTTLTYLPQDMAEQAWDEVGATYNPDIGLAVLPCSHANNQGHFSFGFGGANGPRINVTMDELVLDLTAGQQPRYTSGPFRGQTVCEFGIQNQTKPPYLLGDTFLRSAYVVYDLVNNEIGIAATDFNSTSSNVVAFASSGAPIPSATAAPSQNDASSPPSPTQNSLGAANGFQTETSKSGGGNSTSNDNAAVSLSTFSGPAMITVGLTMVYTLLGGALFGIGWL